MSESVKEIRVAQIVPCTEAEGPGKRFALWFQGCPLRCPGCCNPEMLPFEGGTAYTLDGLIEQIRIAHEKHELEGITLLGGEPMAHAAKGAAIARAVHDLGLNVMLFTGYTIEEAREMGDPDILEMIEETDILVDGPYIREMPETKRRWIGSSNQRIHFLSDRADPNDPRWEMKNTLEIRLIDSELTVNGFPASNAVGLWKRPKPTKPSRAGAEEAES